MNETCDDGLKDSEGCTANCKGILSLWVCINDLTSFPNTKCGLCGNGILEINETCDDGT